MNYKNLRKKKKLSQGEVAKLVGISLVAYTLIEKGITKNPKPETLKKIKEILK
jgi:transcriptional regulator with XRE-family HTH domain